MNSPFVRETAQAAVPQTAGRYALVTAAHNEESYLRATIESVIHQTRLPEQWIIVNDRSTDGTEKIGLDYAARYPFIRMLSIRDRGGRSFGAKVNAIHYGVELLTGIPFEFLGILDADVSFAPNYYESVLKKFAEDARLGLAGGFIHEQFGNVVKSRPANSTSSVAGAIQLFRRECYEAIGGLEPIPYGCEDWAADIKLRCLGWMVRAFPEFAVMHHKPTGLGAGLLRYWFERGKADYLIGSLFSFEAIKCGRRAFGKPLLLASMARMLGFILMMFKKADRCLSAECVRFLQEEQRRRIRTALHLK
jgi:glycosyltransferase involved in cell wall biosynthesis